MPELKFHFSTVVSQYFESSIISPLHSPDGSILQWDSRLLSPAFQEAYHTLYKAYQKMGRNLESVEEAAQIAKEFMKIDTFANFCFYRLEHLESDSEGRRDYVSRLFEGSIDSVKGTITLLEMRRDMESSFGKFYNIERRLVRHYFEAAVNEISSKKQIEKRKVREELNNYRLLLEIKSAEYEQLEEITTEIIGSIYHSLIGIKPKLIQNSEESKIVTAPVEILDEGLHMDRALAKHKQITPGCSGLVCCLPRNGQSSRAYMTDQLVPNTDVTYYGFD